MKRLNIFAKGNLDVRDTLHSLELGGEVRWNGINQLLREMGSRQTIRVRHETAISSEATVDAPGHIPAVFDGRDLSLDHYPLDLQFSRALFEVPVDAFVLSIQPDVMVTCARHAREGYLFHPYELSRWSETEFQWLKSEFLPEPLADAEAAMGHLDRLITALRAVSSAPILIYNMSCVVPGETVHGHIGQEDILSTRIKQFNLALIGLSQRTGASIVDVDRIVAEAGARTMKLDTTHLTEQGCRAVAGEVVRILRDLGVIEDQDRTS